MELGHVSVRRRNFAGVRKGDAMKFIQTIILMGLTMAIVAQAELEDINHDHMITCAGDDGRIVIQQTNGMVFYQVYLKDQSFSGAAPSF
jgi:hypothetical protein